MSSDHKVGSGAYVTELGICQSFLPIHQEIRATWTGPVCFLEVEENCRRKLKYRAPTDGSSSLPLQSSRQ